MMKELSKISKKGLTTIPSKIKEKLGAEEGDYLSWELVEGKVIVDLVKNPYKFLKGRHRDPNLTYDRVEGIADEIIKRDVDAGNRT